MFDPSLADAFLAALGERIGVLDQGWALIEMVERDVRADVNHSSLVRAHHRADGQKRDQTAQGLADRAVASRQIATRAAIDMADHSASSRRRDRRTT